MTKELDSRKYKLIQTIIQMNDIDDLKKIELQIESIQSGTSKLEKIFQVARPMKKSISEMIEEQGYTPLTKETFFEKANGIGIEESLEELLAMLD